MTIVSWEFESPSLHFDCNAAIAQLVERDLAKVEVASPSLVCRSFYLYILFPGCLEHNNNP